MAQGVAAAGIRGAIQDESGTLLEHANVRVINEATGHSARAVARNGRFLVQGLEPGAHYSITVAKVGFVPQHVERVTLRVGELLDAQFRLARVAQVLDTVTVASGTRANARVSGGTAVSIPESELQRLPTLNRDLFDFVRLVPQVSTRNGLGAAAFSAGGVGFRFNNFLINGASERSLGGSVSSAFAGSRSVPLDAVQEYQILVAPYDVRYGDFAGALVNTVTKSGTNRFTGATFVNSRNDRLARGNGAGTGTRYDRVQYGAVVGGPVVRDRLHFLIAPEIQRFTSPARGPYVGQPEAAATPVPVSDSDILLFDQLLRSYGLVGGTGDPVGNKNHLDNLFVRFDLGVPSANSRATVWHSYSGSENLAFSRGQTEFPLTTYSGTGVSRTHITAVQMHSTVDRLGGGHNELLVSRRSGVQEGRVPVRQPIVRVVVPSVSGGIVTLVAGTPETAHGGFTAFASTSAKDAFTIPVGNHLLTIGVESEWFRVRRGRPSGSYGIWTFSSLADLAAGTAERYQVAVTLRNATAPLNGAQYSAYLTDQWQVGPWLWVTAGVRGDMLALQGRPPRHPRVDSLFGRRTDVLPSRRVELSPRVGFTWNPTGSEAHRLRGGMGMFVTRYPLAWAHTAVSNYGISGGQLDCRRGVSSGEAPHFNPDYRAPPQVCANGVGLADSLTGDVDLLDPNLRMMRSLRGSIAYDRQLPGGLLFTGEALATRALSDFVFFDLNLGGPVAVDRYGRVMYGTLSTLGRASPNRRSSFPEVVDLRNTSRNYAYQLAAQLVRAVGERGTASASYTFSRARDVQTPLRVNTRGTINWMSAWMYSGRHDDLRLGISGNDIPHRVVMAGTYAVPRERWRTEISLYYVGESGRPFTYRAWGAAQRGDLNADGVLNDPIYVPRSAFDTSEIRFSGFSDSAGADNSAAVQGARAALQQQAFEQFVESTRCLRSRRGRILERNSCREPWSNTTLLSARQFFPVRGQTWQAQLDVFNVLNLLNSEWGLQRQSDDALLEHFRQTPGDAASTEPIFRYNASRSRWVTVPAESAFQLQLGLRYRF